jgi:hypothetical protein
MKTETEAEQIQLGLNHVKAAFNAVAERGDIIINELVYNNSCETVTANYFNANGKSSKVINVFADSPETAVMSDTIKSLHELYI